MSLALVRDLPQTHAALTRGDISEWRATLIVRETATLCREDRMQVDRELAGHLNRAGDRRIADLARKISYRLDPGAILRRNQKAEADRRVTIHPAPDTMSNVTGLLPVAQGVAVYACLRKHAESLRAQDDARTIAQLMADTFYQRLTGREATDGDVEIQLVMSERTLLRGDSEPAHLVGYGAIPAFLARRLVRDSDHVRQARRGGRTSLANGQGLCEACDYTRETPGWRADVITTEGHVVEITTPTGHAYSSSPPQQPGDPPGLTLEQRFRRLLDDVA